jgi:hypothetical protein
MSIFAQERAAYGRCKPALLASAEGKFVVIKGDEMLGPFDGYGAALADGYERFGAVPFLVKQVLAVEPVVTITRVLTGDARLVPEQRGPLEKS